MERTNAVAVVEVESLSAYELTDRGQREGLRDHASTVRWLVESGSSLKSVAATFGKSYEWTRRVAKNVAYEYDNAALELVPTDVALSN
jgi:hypothetical protein